jgi:hypothetical protein
MAAELKGKWYYCTDCRKTVYCIKDGDGNWVCAGKHVVYRPHKRIRR